AIRGPIATALPARPSRRIAAGKTALRRLVMILQRDQESLERAQRYECRQEYQRAPQQRVNPVRRRIKDFHHQCRPGDNKAGKKTSRKKPVRRRSRQRRNRGRTARNANATQETLGTDGPRRSADSVP